MCRDVLVLVLLLVAGTVRTNILGGTFLVWLMYFLALIHYLDLDYASLYFHADHAWSGNWGFLLVYVIPVITYWSGNTLPLLTVRGVGFGWMTCRDVTCDRSRLDFP